jgi:hypothetical protein
MEENHVKCTRQPALTAVKNAKYHSNQTQADQFTAENAGLREDPQEDHATRFHKVRILTLAINL